jgi:hypothetical protein
VEGVEEAGGKGEGGARFDIHPVTGLAVFRVPEGARRITMEDVKGAEEEG